MSATGCTCPTPYFAGPFEHLPGCPTRAVVAIGSSGRHLNLKDRRAGVPELILCPRCEGQTFDQGSCSLCGNCGYLKSEGAERLDYAEMVQILATFALATGINLTAKEPA